jgi:hypothetical protein
MTSALVAPSASASPETQADWLELVALSKADKNSSIEDLVREHRRSGSIDGLGDFESIEEATDTGSRKSQQVAEDAFGELSDRQTVCGPSYPFDVQARYVQAKTRYSNSVYAFLLAMSQFGRDAGPPELDGAELFDQVCAAASEEYFGGADRGAKSYLFGFPRRLTPSGFEPALNDLCAQMGEGGGCKDRPTTGDQNDAKLDLVVWRPFGDGRAGKLIGFGQCATGDNWPGKVSELQMNFCRTWMNEQPAVDPVRMFFVPFRVERRKWYVRSSAAGILFDRCRIAILSRRLSNDLRKRCQLWTERALRDHL